MPRYWHKPLLLIATSLAAVAGVARADAPRIELGPEPKRPGGINNICGPQDPDCRGTLRVLLTNGGDFPIEVTEGMTFGPSGVSGTAVKFKTHWAGVDRMSGDGRAIVVDAIYLSEGEFRVRLTLAETQAVFYCKDRSGNTVSPVKTVIKGSKVCVPEPNGAFATFGAGGKFVQVQWDVISGRVAARWLEIQGILNLLGNANTSKYLQSRLQAYAGVSLDTIWYGDTPGVEPERGGASIFPRGSFGISAMFRPKSNHWEIQGLAGVRQNLIDSSDFTFESRVQALYHVLLTRQNLMKIGAEAQYLYNTVPSHSMGDFASDRERSAAYAGFVLGFVFR